METIDQLHNFHLKRQASKHQNPPSFVDIAIKQLHETSPNNKDDKG